MKQLWHWGSDLRARRFDLANHRPRMLGAACADLPQHCSCPPARLRQGPRMAAMAAPARQFTAEELRQYDGRDGGPVYIALRGRVLDVSEGRSFYGPGGPYAIFGGALRVSTACTLSSSPKGALPAADHTRHGVRACTRSAQAPLRPSGG